MGFKKNITVTVACVITECLLSLVPAITIIYLFFMPDKLSDIFSTLFIIPYVILIINVILLIISIIARLFIHTKYFVGEEKLTIISRKGSTGISYNEISAIAYDFGDLNKWHAKASQLVLLGKDSKQLLTISNPPIILVRKIKAKCKNIKINYYHNKRFLYLLSLINVTILLISVLAKLIF